MRIFAIMQRNFYAASIVAALGIGWFVILIVSEFQVLVEDEGINNTQ